MHPIREKAFKEGQEAVASGDGTCPYISGQRVMEDWGNGVVSAVECEADIPEGLNPFYVGRCYRKLGIWPDDRGCKAAGREFSGYLAERDIEYHRERARKAQEKS